MIKGPLGILAPRSLLVGVVSVWLASLAVPSRAEDEDLALVSRLSAENLPQLAQDYLVHRLRQPGLPPRQQTQLINRQLQLITERALATPWERREEVWRAERELYEQWQAQLAGSPLWLLVELQHALNGGTLGRLERLESELTAQAELRQHAQDVLRSTLKQAETLAQKLQQALQLSGGTRPRPGRTTESTELTSDQLLSLKQQTELLLAETFFQQGLTYAPKSADWTNSLGRSLDATIPLARLRDGSAIEFTASLLEAEVLAATHRSAEARERFQQLSARWSAESLQTSETQNRLHELAMRLSLQEERWSDALQLALERATWGQRPEHDLTVLEVLLRTRQHAAANVSEPVAAALSELLAVIHEHFAGFTERRADLLLARSSTLPSQPSAVGSDNTSAAAELKQSPPLLDPVATSNDGDLPSRSVDSVVAAASPSPNNASVSNASSTPDRTAAAAGPSLRADTTAPSVTPLPTAARSPRPSALEAEILGRAAAALLREGKPAEAVAQYDQAAAAAGKLGRVDLEFDWLRQAAGIVAQQREFAAAAKRYCTLARTQVDHPQASDMHLKGILCWAQAARQTPEQVRDYEQSLTEHLQTWSRGAATDRARIWLAQLYQTRSDAAAAVQVLREIPLNSSERARSLPLLMVNLQRQLANLPTAAERRQLAVETVQAWESELFPDDVATNGSQPLSQRDWSEGQWATLLAVARLRLTVLQESSQHIRPLLEQMVDRGAPAAVPVERDPPATAATPVTPAATSESAPAAHQNSSAQQLNEARLLLALALAFEQNWDAVQAQLQGWEQASTDELLTAAEQIGQLGLQAPAAQQPQIARLIDQLLTWRQRPNLALNAPRTQEKTARESSAVGATESLVRWAETEALAGRLAGDSARAREAYDRAWQLAMGSSPLPLDQQSSLLLRYAEWLQGQTEDAARQRLVELWRTRVEQTAPVSEAWWQAKLELARSLVAAGSPEQALKMIQVLEVLHPDLGGPRLRPEFLTLKRDLPGARK